MTKDKSMVVLERQKTADDEDVLHCRHQKLELKNQPIKDTVLDSDVMSTCHPTSPKITPSDFTRHR